MAQLAAPSRWIVICCPVAGKKTGKKVTEEDFLPECERLGLQNVEVIYTERARHATEIAKQYGSPTTGLIAVGGDGTTHEVLDGLIEKGLLGQVPVGLLGQGTMNLYAVSGGLPDASTLPTYLQSCMTRPQGLMKCNSDAKLPKDTLSFEALYFGVGYKPAKGAQEWRSTLGPFFGIMSNLVRACAFPDGAAVEGTMRLTAPDGSVSTLTENFYWIILSQRSPYNGTLSDDMWVSWMALDDFPGFGRMMDFFKPPMELFSGLTAVMSGHAKIKKFEFTQEESSGPIGVCLDGDPMDCGQSISVEHLPRAWNIVADSTYPSEVPEEHTKVGFVTPAGHRWLSKYPVPAGVYVPAPAPTPGGCCGNDSSTAHDYVEDSE